MEEVGVEKADVTTTAEPSLTQSQQLAKDVQHLELTDNPPPSTGTATATPTSPSIGTATDTPTSPSPSPSPSIGTATDTLTSPSIAGVGEGVDTSDKPKVLGEEQGKDHKEKRKEKKKKENLKDKDDKDLKGVEDNHEKVDNHEKEKEKKEKEKVDNDEKEKEKNTESPTKKPRLEPSEDTDTKETKKKIKRISSTPSSDPTKKKSPVSKTSVRPPFFNSKKKTQNPFRTSLKKMYQIQQEQLTKFRKKADKGDWGAIHRDHFDWFMFPIEDGSQSQYNVLAGDIEELKADEKWRQGYLEAVRLVAKAWGWDVETASLIDPPLGGMGWTHWDVRLAKIIRSLWIFKEKEYLHSMQKFALHVAPKGGLSYGYINLDEVYFMGVDSEGKHFIKESASDF